MKFEGPRAARVKAICWRMHARRTARRSLWVTNGRTGCSTSTTAGPWIADDFARRSKSAAQGQFRTNASPPRSQSVQGDTHLSARMTPAVEQARGENIKRER